MQNGMRRLTALLPALGLVAGLILMAPAPSPTDKQSGVCVGGLSLVACVPPGSDQPNPQPG
jgi:hypothetical protein